MKIAYALCALALVQSASLFQATNAQTSVIRRVTDSADWTVRYAAKAFTNTVATTAAVGAIDPSNPNQPITRKLIPAGSLFVQGGINENNMSNDDVWCSTSSGKSWDLVGGKRSHYATSALPDRLFSGGCYDHLTGRTYSVGGIQDGRTINHTSRVVSSSDGLHWEMITDSADFSFRIRAACAVDVKGQVIVVGGLGNGETLNDVWRSSDLGASWRQVTSKPQFGRRAGMSMQTFNSSLLNMDLIYLVGGEQEVNNALKVTNDVWVSSNSGGSWTQLTARAPFPARTNARLTIVDNGILIVSGGRPADGSTVWHNDIWVSIDGALTWKAACANRKCGYLPRMDHMAIMDKNGYYYIMGGVADTGETDGLNDVWQSAFSFKDPEVVAERLGLEMPVDGFVGLRCWPTDEDCMPDPDNPDDGESSTGSHSDTGNSKSGLTIEAVLGIVGALIFSLALLYYIARRYKGWLDAKQKLREAEMQYLNQGVFSAPTTHTSVLMDNAYERSDLYEPPQSHGVNHTSAQNQPQPF